MKESETSITEVVVAKLARRIPLQTPPQQEPGRTVERWQVVEAADGDVGAEIKVVVADGGIRR